MRTEVVLVTPAMARQWLLRNTSNRPLRRLTVDGFKGAWSRGEWRLTHQGIAFGKDKVLKDGQHRLTFISELPDDAAVPLMVTHDVDDDVFGVLDRGITRSVADELAIDTSLAAIGGFLAAVYNFNQRFGCTPQYLLPFIRWAQPIYSDITAFCGTKRAVWSSAPVLAAAVVQIARGSNADYVKACYRSLVMRDTAVMPPSAAALLRQVIDGKAGGSRSYDLFARALRVFDSRSSQKLGKIQIKDVGAVTAEVRDYLESVFSVPKIERPNKKARTRRAEG
jgi:hypothetical protein